MEEQMRQLIVAFGITTLTATVAIAQGGGQKPSPSAAQADHSMMLMDADFAYLMGMHHRSGIEMAKAEEARGSSSEVKRLAAKIRRGQERDLPTLTQYGSKAKNSGMVASHEKQMEKEHQASMAKLKSATGGAVDKAFAEEMSKHHQKALDMIKQAHLADSRLKQATDKMAAAQKQELAELKTVR